MQCAECKQWFKKTQMDKDHIVPCGSLLKYDDLPGFVERMFVGVDDYRILCKPCHTVITNKSRKKKD